MGPSIESGTPRASARAEPGEPRPLCGPAERRSGRTLIKNFLARIGCLTLVALVAAGAWLARDDIMTWLGRLDLVPASEPSEALAARAEEKLATLEDDTRRDVELGEAELQSLLTYRVAPFLPAGLEDPVVSVRDSTLVLSALVRPERLDRFAPPELLQQFLADTSRVAAELVPGLEAPGTGRLRVETIQAGALVIPGLMVPFVLQSLEIPDVETSGGRLLVRLPRGVTAVEVRDGALVLRETGDGAIP